MDQTSYSAIDPNSLEDSNVGKSNSSATIPQDDDNVDGHPSGNADTMDSAGRNSSAVQQKSEV